MTTFIRLTPTELAGNRTKNRLLEHSGDFQLIKEGNPISLQGQPSLFLKHEDGWFGWLSKSEVEMVLLHEPNL